MNPEMREKSPIRHGAIRTLFVYSGDAPPQALLEALEREAIRTGVISWSSFSNEPSWTHDVLVLWMARELSVADVRTVVEWAKRRAPETPALMGCRSNGDINDSIAAFEAGLDTVVVGRCGGRELACRIRALHRRSALRTGHRPRLRSKLRIDPHNQEAWVGRRSVPLTLTELGVLRTLLQAQGETLTRLELLDRAWHNDKGADIGVRAVDNVILRLRRKLGDSSLIETVRGIGFRLGPGSPTTEPHLSA